MTTVRSFEKLSRVYPLAGRTRRDISSSWAPWVVEELSEGSGRLVDKETRSKGQEQSEGNV